MSKKGIHSNYFHMGLQAIFFFLTCNYLRVVLHEIGHGLGASAVGMNFVGIYTAVFGSSYSLIHGTGPTWQYVVRSFSGPGVDLLLGLCIYFIILPRVKRWGSQLFWLFLAITTLFAFWGYMVIGGLLRSGDFANLAGLLGIPNLLVGALGLIGLVGFAFLLTRRIFTVLSPYFPLNSFSQRLGTLFLFLGLPCIIYVGVGKLVSRNFSLTRLLTELFLIVGILIVVTLLSLLTKVPSQTIQSLPKRATFTGAAAFILVTIVWLGVFGVRYEQAKGVVWGTPSENSVSFCNIHILIERDSTAQVDFLMRPWGDSLRWKKLENLTPDWTVYLTFIEKNMPVLLGVDDYSVAEKQMDTVTPIYMGVRFRGTGCRKITVLTDLRDVLQKMNENTFALNITDFWQQTHGYLDRLEVKLSEGMKFTAYEIEPPQANRPGHFDEQRIFWENDSYKTAPGKIHLLISRAEAQ